MHAHRNAAFARRLSCGLAASATALLLVGATACSSKGASDKGGAELGAVPPELIGTWNRVEGYRGSITVGPTGLSSSDTSFASAVSFATISCSGTTCTWTSDGADSAGQGSFSLDPSGRLSLQTATERMDDYDNSLSGLFERPQGTASAAPGSICKRVQGVWTAEVNADTGGIYGSDRPKKSLLIDERNIRLSVAGDGMPAEVGWTGWNTDAPTEDAGACVYAVRETVHGEGFIGMTKSSRANPYVVIKAIRLKPAEGGVELRLDVPPDAIEKLKCDRSLKDCDKINGDAHSTCLSENNDLKNQCVAEGMFLFTDNSIARVKGWLKSLDGSFWKK